MKQSYPLFLANMNNLFGRILNYGNTEHFECISTCTRFTGGQLRILSGHFEITLENNRFLTLGVVHIFNLCA